MFSPKPRRRWLQFRLSTLLIVVTLVSLLLGYVAWEREQCRRGEEAVKMLEETILSANPVGFLPTTTVDTIERTPLGRTGWLKGILGDDRFRNVEGALLIGDSVSDAELRQLNAIPNLQAIMIFGTKVTESGIADLRGPNVVELSIQSYSNTSGRSWKILGNWQKLERLSFERSHFGDDGFVNLPGTKQLKALSFRNTNVSDAGLEGISSLTTLEELDLGFTSISDAGLKHLSGLTNLLMLDLYGTKVTDAGIKKLEDALPNVSIGHSTRL